MLLSLSVSAQVIELTFWHGFSGAKDQQKLNEMTERFNATHPGIRVFPDLQTAGSVDKLLVALATGVGPDIFWQTGGIILQTREYLLPLDDFIDAEPGFREDHFPGLWLDATWEGVTYGIPFEHASVGLTLNTRRFLEAGLDTAGPQTWEEFREAAIRLTDPSEELYGLNIDLNNLSWLTSVNYGSFLTTNGGAFMSPDEKEPLIATEAAIETLEFLHDIIQVSRASTPQTPSISSGTVGMQVGLPSLPMNLVRNGYLEGSIGTAMIPAKVQRGAINTSKNLFIVKSTPERDRAAWEYIRWLVSPENNFEWHVATLSYLPTRRSVVGLPEFQEWMMNNPLMRPWLEQAEFVVSRPRSVEWTITIKHLQEAVRRSLVEGTTPPRTALDEAYRQAVAEIAQLK